MKSLNKTENVEMINLFELESNKDNDLRVTCPKCSHDSIIKKSYKIDIPKAIGFVFFLGASFALVLLINAIVLIREKMKINKLPKGIREQVQENKMSLLGLQVPTKTKIECSKCQHVFFENYDTGDFIIVFVFFFIVVILVFAAVFLFWKYKK